ncbi:MAG: UDP-N-acetylmuramate dehydrogenase [Candidatus Vogelbacteria bacterium]|nr:UDP-N-acetylmuramate dehydrogenase [Candidatus Vogelbacteria bacterium]
MSLRPRKNEPLARHTTFGIAGTAEYFVEVDSVAELEEAISHARERGLQVTVIAGGSNVVCAERVSGLVIKLLIKGRSIEGLRVCIGAGETLLETVNAANSAGLRGLETLAGIPGTVGGALVGNAGAYGTEIGQNVVSIEAYNGSRVISIRKSECAFSYRNSIFKKRREYVILSVIFELCRGDAATLAQKSADIINQREQKYPPGLLCPGSFFKNIPADSVPPSVSACLPERALVHGKIAVGYLVEAVGGRGLCVGGACVAEYHGNLLVNIGNATFDDVRQLAETLRQKVRERFGIELEEEVRYIS